MHWSAIANTVFEKLRRDQSSAISPSADFWSVTEPDKEDEMEEREIENTQPQRRTFISSINKQTDIM